MKLIISGVVASLAAATLVSLASTANADAGETVTVRPGGFDTHGLSDTRSAGHVEFLEDGLHVYTDDASSDAKAAEYVDVPTQGLPDSASLTWYGTSPQPGSQIVFDMDGDRTNDNTFNILVGEPTYGDDFWYTGGQTRAAARGFSCPETSGGSGSDCHGTLAEWQQTLPDAEVYAIGFSLGSGIKGDGFIQDIKVGDTDYRFTNEAAVHTVPVTGDATARVWAKAHYDLLKIKMVTDALGENQVQGHKLWFRVTDNGATVFHSKLGADDKADLNLTFVNGTGKHVVTIIKNGEVVQKVVIRTGGHGRR